MKSMNLNNICSEDNKKLFSREKVRESGDSSDINSIQIPPEANFY
jgi:hypothetical protein